ncbi:DUF3048 domain-containing protein [Candidatus Dojkabacteria bacterium]|nr:DUF3048 domain-containing protein [Candidatus Dojkabacteria bacterium]
MKIIDTTKNPNINQSLPSKTHSTATNSPIDPKHATSPMTHTPLESSIPTKIKERKLLKFLKAIKNWVSKLPFVPRILVISLPFALIIGGIGYFTYTSITSRVDPQKINLPSDIDAKVNNPNPSIFLEQISDPKTMENPINGIFMSVKEYEKMTETPPIAVMIENHPDARPQTGLIYADIVFETLAEGGITRFMPIYWSHMPEYVGPVRSTRLYYIHWLLPFDAIYAHIGGAVTDSPNTNAMGALFTYNVKTVGFSDIYWRDSKRASPHNAYVNTEDMISAAKTLGYSMESNFTNPPFKTDATYTNRGETSCYVIPWKNFTSGMDVEFKYDKDSNSYKRYLAGQPHVDAITGSQISVKTVIIEETTFTQSFDYEGHLILGTTGQGNATIYIDGKKIDATWSKSNVNDRTKYYVRGTNEEVVFNRGQIWVMILPINLYTLQDR